MDGSCGQLWPRTIQVQASCQCVCVVTVRSSVVIIHGIQLPHKPHIQAQLQISGSKWANFQYILGFVARQVLPSREEKGRKCVKGPDTGSGRQKLKHTVRWRVEIKGKEGVKLRYREQEKATRAV